MTVEIIPKESSNEDFTYSVKLHMLQNLFKAELIQQ